MNALTNITNKSKDTNFVQTAQISLGKHATGAIVELIVPNRLAALVIVLVVRRQVDALLLVVALVLGFLVLLGPPIVLDVVYARHTIQNLDA
jgi:hypothetical protein